MSLFLQKREGYENLIKLSRRFISAMSILAQSVRRLFLEINQVSLFYLEVCLTSLGFVGTGHTQKARELASRWKNEFGDSYYIEITRTGRLTKKPSSKKLKSLSIRYPCGRNK